MSQINNYAKKIIKLVANDDFETAIQEATILFEGSPLFYELAVQQSRHKVLLEKIRQGQLTYEEADTETNKLKYALLDMVRTLEEGLVNQTEALREVEHYLITQMPTNNAVMNGDNNIVIQGVQARKLKIKTDNSK